MQKLNRIDKTNLVQLDSATEKLLCLTRVIQCWLFMFRYPELQAYSKLLCLSHCFKMPSNVWSGSPAIGKCFYVIVDIDQETLLATNKRLKSDSFEYFSRAGIFFCFSVSNNLLHYFYFSSRGKSNENL